MDDLEVNEIPVCCGTFPAVLEVRAARIRYASGDTVEYMRPQEFEALAGRASAKKWKASLRVRGGDADNMPIGDYLHKFLKVDINNGKCTPYSSKAEKPSEDKLSRPKKKCATVAGPDLARTSSSSSASSSDSIQVKEPLKRRTVAVASAEALKTHFLSTRICYEAPTPADRGSGSADTHSYTITLTRPWPSLHTTADTTNAVKERAEEFAPAGGLSHSRVPGASSRPAQDADSTMHSVHDVQLQMERASASTAEAMQEAGGSVGAQSGLPPERSSSYVTEAACMIAQDTQARIADCTIGEQAGAVKEAKNEPNILVSDVTEPRSPPKACVESATRLEAFTVGQLELGNAEPVSGCTGKMQVLQAATNREMYNKSAAAASPSAAAGSREVRGQGAEASGHTVQVSYGRAHAASPCVLDLSETSAAQLMALGRASGAATAFEGCFLRRPESEMPGVRLSKISLVTNERNEVAGPPELLKKQRALQEQQAQQRKLARAALKAAAKLISQPKGSAIV